MTKVAPIDQRKADHIKINLEHDVRSALTTGLEKYRFIHEALPELDLNRIDTTQQLFGKKNKFPHSHQLHDRRNSGGRDHQPAAC